MKHHKLIICLLGALFLILSNSVVFSAGNTVVEDVIFPPKTGSKKILTVSSPKGERKYSHSELEAIGLKRLKTKTFWPGDCSIFEGVLLIDLLKDNGMESAQQIKLMALDDYAAIIPIKDWRTWPVLIATRCEGKPLSIRSKGPTRIIYPNDHFKGELGNSQERVKWIWTIKSISIKN